MDTAYGHNEIRIHHMINMKSLPVTHFALYNLSNSSLIMMGNLKKSYAEFSLATRWPKPVQLIFFNLSNSYLMHFSEKMYASYDALTNILAAIIFW